MSLSALGLSSSTPKILARIGWVVVENTADVSGEAPGVTQNADDPLQATVGLNGRGSFNVICYYDENENGVYDPGEELKAFHLAEVAVDVYPSERVEQTSNANFFEKSNGVKTAIRSGGNTSQFAIKSSETAQVVGGGSDGMIGVDKIHLGWVQNGTADTVAVQYQSGHLAVESLHHGDFPILDANYDADVNRPFLIFGLPPGIVPTSHTAGITRDPVTDPSDPSGGQDRTVATADSPGIVFPSVMNASPAVTLSGVNDFAIFLSAYSDDFNRTYASDLMVSWTVQYSYAQSNGVWTNTGSSIVASTSSIQPATLSSIGVKTTGPLYVDEVDI